MSTNESAQKGINPTCSDCGVQHCGRRNSSYPEFCLTTKLDQEMIDEVWDLYNDPVNRNISRISAEIESDFYCRYTRVEEIIIFCHRMGYKKIGIATCGGLAFEARIFTQILRKNGLEPFGVVCKVGSFDKSEVGIAPEDQIKTGPVMCNPIMQAKILNKEKTDFNVVMGLCVGHDTLFYKYIEGPCTTLITKDRALCHNPAAALYQTQGFGYFRRLLNTPVEDIRDQK